MADIIHVAQYFLLLNQRMYEKIAQEDDREFIFETQPDTITHLKLQKLVYYAQGLHLAYFRVPLFAQNIEAWEHGPVVSDLYSEFRQYGKNDLMSIFKDIQECDLSLNDDEKFIIKMAFKQYGKFSAIGLRNKTHSEPTWYKTFQRGKNNVIDNETMQEFFTKQIENDLCKLYKEL